MIAHHRKQAARLALASTLAVSWCSLAVAQQLPSESSATSSVRSAPEAVAPQQVPGGTPAPTTEDSTSTITDTSGKLVDIVVTAQRRSQRIERVPASVQVVSGAAIAQFLQTDLRSVAVNVPNLVLTSSPSGAVSANIRGIGTPSANAGFEQSVALYVDGIYQPRPHSYTGSLFDIDRIEVVKGTQGTLFGKNASVGAISLITGDPKAKFGGYVNASYGFTLREPRLEGAVNLPMGKKLRVRIAGLYDDANKGWVRNIATSEKYPQSTEYGIRGKADWDLTDNLTVNGKLEYNKTKRVGNAFVLVPGNEVGGGVNIGNIITNTSSSLLGDSGGLPGLRRRSDTEVIGATWHLGDYTITALSGWQKLKLNSFIDFDVTTGPIDYAVVYHERFSQFTQELRIASDETKRFQYMGGLFYLDQSLSYQTQFRFAPSPADNLLKTSVNTYSGFLQGKYKLTDALAFTAGARVTNEIKNGALRSTKNLGSATTAERVETTNVDWNAILEYAVVDGTQLYASVSRGHKAPGFLNSVPGAAIVPERLVLSGEKATNYEIGIKSRFLDGRARGNLALYNLEVANYQGSEYVPSLLSFVASNVDVRARGAEAELQFQVSAPLQIGFNGAFNDGIIKSNGNQMINAPRWNATANFNYAPHLTDVLQGNFSGQFNYISKFPNQFDLQPGNYTPGRTNLDLRLGVKHEPTGIDVALVGRNVTNNRFVDFASGYPFAPTNTVFLDQVAKPRTIAVEVHVPFGRR